MLWETPVPVRHPGQQYQEEISSYLMESDFSGTIEAIFEVPSFLSLSCHLLIFGGGRSFFFFDFDFLILPRSNHCWVLSEQDSFFCGVYILVAGPD